LWIPAERRLLRRYRADEAAIDGYAEDYAYLIFGLIELFQAEGDQSWLEWARTLQARQDELFWDDDGGGWFSTTGRDPSVLLRLKEDYDGAEPAASSIAVANLIALEHLIGSDEANAWHARAERTLARYGPRIGAAARVIPMMLASLSAWHADHAQVVIVGDRDAADTQDLLQALARRYAPFAIVVPVAPGDRQKSISAMLPFVDSMAMRDTRATAYVCRSFTCREPTTDAGVMLEQL
jgi:uncharacterized protein YyaL (SSP411 family)